jgi:hypothetical protein
VISEKWDWSGTEEEWVKDWCATICHQFLAVSGVHNEFQHMIDLNMDFWELDQRVGLNLDTVVKLNLKLFLCCPLPH